MIQFNFREHWDAIRDKYLSIPAIEFGLLEGLKDCVRFLMEDRTGRGYKRAEMYKFEFPHSKTDLEWLRSWPSSHSLCLFVYGLAVRIYPELEWEMIENHAHSIVVGYEKNPTIVPVREYLPHLSLLKALGAKVVMDIKLFDICTAQFSFDLATLSPEEFCEKYDEDEVK